YFILITTDQHTFPTRRSSDLMTPGYQTYFDTWKGFAFIVNGVDQPRKWDGSKVLTMENAPKGAKFVVHYADRLFMPVGDDDVRRSEEHTSELQSRENLVCRLL